MIAGPAGLGRFARACVTAAAVALPIAGLGAYALLEGEPRWPAGNIVMHLELGNAGPLSDGSRTYGVVAESTLAEWNAVLNGRQFQVVRDSTSPQRDGDEVNQVFFADRIYGERFDGAVAVTTIWVRGSTRVEGDVVFNNTLTWDSYRGGLRRNSGGSPIYDFRRVALHEFGHVIGLDHPDEAGQNVTAIMDSDSFDEERLYPDDIAGVSALYGAVAPPPPPPSPGTPVVINFPPRNESLDFRNVLERVYAEGLGRQPGDSYVDIEGTVVWTQEYLRYRVNQCPHQEAVNRVMLQIDGRGIQPVCGTSRSVAFPPRNEPFDFRLQLEAKYRDGLRRSPSRTAVDTEGDIVWTQEYLRYRVSGCNHPQAQDRVLLQIGGGGIAPACS